MKSATKVVKNNCLTKKNLKIMEKNLFIGNLEAKKIIALITPAGYMEVLEYILPDMSFLHIIKWHFSNILEENTLEPKINSKIFFRDKLHALEYAQEIGNDLLKCI